MVEKIKRSNSSSIAQFCVVEFKLNLFSPKKFKIKFGSSEVFSTPKKNKKERKKEEKNMSCNLGLKSNLSYNLGFLGHHQATLDTEGCLVMAKNVKNPSYNSIFTFPSPNNLMENKTQVIVQVFDVIRIVLRWKNKGQT
jgi:hypothetical protein